VTGNEIDPSAGASLNISTAVEHGMQLSEEVRAALTSGHLAHLVTIEPDGSPQVTVVWVGLEGDEILTGHFTLRRKVANMKRDPRVVLSVET
jgi:hypothetical protein